MPLFLPRRLGSSLRSLAAVASLALVAAGCSPDRAGAQMLHRMGDPARADFSDLDVGPDDFRATGERRDSLLRLGAASDAAALWRTAVGSLTGENLAYGEVALHRLADLRVPAYADSAGALLARLRANAVPGLATESEHSCDAGCLSRRVAPLLETIIVERDRAVRGDQAVLGELLGRLATPDERIGDANAITRFGASGADSLLARFRIAPPKLRQKYFVRLAGMGDPRLIPVFAQAYVSPDSLGLRPQVQSYAVRGLAWIGTRAAVVALRDARVQAESLGVHDSASTALVDLWMVMSSGSTVDELAARLPENEVPAVRLDADVRPSQWNTAFRQTGNVSQGNVAIYVGMPTGTGALDDIQLASLRLGGPGGGAVTPTGTRIQRNGDRRFPNGYVEVVFDHDAAAALVPATAPTGTLVPLVLSGTLTGGRALRAEALVRMVGP